MMLIASGLVLALIYYGMRPRAVVARAAPGAGRDVLRRHLRDVFGPDRATRASASSRSSSRCSSSCCWAICSACCPYSFTYTSHIAITFALAALVIVLVTVVALRIHGLHFFTYFFPAGAPKLLAPLIIPVEIISYLSRPVSLSIRLFANMVAGPRDVRGVRHLHHHARRPRRAWHRRRHRAAGAERAADGVRIAGGLSSRPTCSPSSPASTCTTRCICTEPRPFPSPAGLPCLLPRLSTHLHTQRTETMDPASHCRRRQGSRRRLRRDRACRRRHRHRQPSSRRW